MRYDFFFSKIRIKKKGKIESQTHGVFLSYLKPRARFAEVTCDLGFGNG